MAGITFSTSAAVRTFPPALFLLEVFFVAALLLLLGDDDFAAGALAPPPSTAAVAAALASCFAPPLDVLDEDEGRSWGEGYKKAKKKKKKSRMNHGPVRSATEPGFIPKSTEKFQSICEGRKKIQG